MTSASESAPAQSISINDKAVHDTHWAGLAFKPANESSFTVSDAGRIDHLHQSDVSEHRGYSDGFTSTAGTNHLDLNRSMWI